jgi:hypothetical protein
MFARLRSRRPSHAAVVAYLALFVALGGTGAYAANTIGSADVIDESLLSQDIKNAEVKTSDLANAAVTRDKLGAGSVINGKLGASAVTGSKVLDNSLGGADILESSLSQVPSATNASNASNADTLGGQGPGAFLGANAKAVDSDRLDGKDSSGFMQGNGRVFSNRVVATAQGTSLLNIPFTGEFTVDGCDHTNGRVFFDVKGTGNVYFTSDRAGVGIDFQQPLSTWLSPTGPTAYYHIQLARNTDSGTQLTQVELTWKATDCVFAAQAVQQPAL